MFRVTDDIFVTKIYNATFTVTSIDERTRLRRDYTTFLGSDKNFCSSTCNVFT